ncbi:MAG TPA: hypothetical protein VGI38_12850 [Puia sp.]|jgi:hypothetical protein
MELPNKIEPVILTLTAQKEKNNEQAAAFIIGKLDKHSVIIRKGTTFLIIFSILALYAAMYLIHMESLDRHLQSHANKTVIR